MWSGYDDLNGDRMRMLVAALVGALLVGVVWFAQSLFTRDTDSTPGGAVDRRSSAADSSADRDRPAYTGTGSTHLDRCREVYAAQAEPLRAAAASLEQWEVHIGAMNKLVTGAITLTQANQFWNQTRIGASRRLDAFATASHHYGQRTARCPQPGRSADVASDLSSCARAVLERNRTLELAGIALQTWEVHVHHMNMLRAGQMTPAQATAAWLQNWREGDRQVRAYRAAVRASDGLTC